MSKLMLATAVGAVVATAASSAMASDVNQILSATQRALNSISSNSSDYNDHNTSQTATNLGNLVNFDTVVHHINQLATGDQTAYNYAAPSYSRWQMLTQSATNVLNSVNLKEQNSDLAHSVGSLTQNTQSLVPGGGAADQTATNTAYYTDGYTGLDGYDPNLPSDATTYVPPSQSAVNAANIASVYNVNGFAEQGVSSDSSQTASNNILDAHPGVKHNTYANVINDANQVATNIGNSLTATDNVAVLLQGDSGDQTATNVMQYGDGKTDNPSDMSVPGLKDSSQAATNVSNTATLANVNYFSAQISSQQQRATNSASFVDAGTGAGHSSVDNFIQSATNIANSMTQKKLDDSDSIPFLFQSTSDFFGNAAADQTASNTTAYQGAYVGAHTADQYAASVKADLQPKDAGFVAASQSAVNAANLANVDSIDYAAVQYVSRNTSQTATNKILIANPSPAHTAGVDGPAVENANQVATNIGNSLSATDSVDVVWQANYGPQTASNLIQFGNGVTAGGIDALLNSSQTATNVSNSVTLNTLADFSRQYSDQKQVATNTALYDDSAKATWTSGGVIGLAQTGVNAANLLTVSTLPSLSGTTEVLQKATGSQLVQNTLTTPGTLRNVVQSATNIANSLSVPSN